MNEREIVIETLRHRRCDVIPHNIDFTSTMREKMCGALGLASAADVSEAVGNYFVQLNVGSVTGPSEGVIPEIYPKRVGPETYRDDWGVVWRREPGDDIGVVERPAIPEPTLTGFTAPEPAPRGKWLEAFARGERERFRLVSLSSPIFQRAWFLRGFENFLVDLALHERFVHELVEMILEYTTKVVREAVSYDIDGLFFMDDWGQQEGLLISPEMWRRYFKGGMEKLFRMAKERGLSVFFHSCGNIEALIGELVEMGVDVLNPFQPEVMDVYRLKREYGGRLSFYGGIGTQNVLPHGRTEEVKADVREKIRLLGEGGGYILAPAHAVQADAPVENVLAMVEALREQRGA
ncbi:MAG: uroporphyrinogen decarboxylase family protein [Planctomycetota bacterium]